ncbi:hypothetical protein TRFO_19960 [Tritrichomonas foetus]|uniref:Uncharacterized protein n=1 Tax=Tritrichomonas foetus TaxID=1144522 RepID=A0A1J4KH35_9EUKA|nr:hypothetical protein TRFO_19960 [Tritrichomonas foetus]|eukprot:OHT10727.1 hypothetical protein TRFO_19960 [Tritrichomonas foetus]
MSTENNNEIPLQGEVPNLANIPPSAETPVDGSKKKKSKKSKNADPQQLPPQPYQPGPHPPGVPPPYYQPPPPYGAPQPGPMPGQPPAPYGAPPNNYYPTPQPGAPNYYPQPAPGAPMPVRGGNIPMPGESPVPPGYQQSPYGVPMQNQVDNGKKSELYNTYLPGTTGKYAHLWNTDEAFLPHKFLENCEVKISCEDIIWVIIGFIIFWVWFGFSCHIIRTFNVYTDIDNLIGGYGSLLTNIYQSNEEPFGYDMYTIFKYVFPFDAIIMYHFAPDLFTGETGMFVGIGLLITVFEMAMAFLWPKGYNKYSRYFLMLVPIFCVIKCLTWTYWIPAIPAIIMVLTLICAGNFNHKDTTGQSFLNVASTLLWKCPFATLIIFFVQVLIFHGLWAIFWYALFDSIFLINLYYGSIFIFFGGLWVFAFYARFCSMIDANLFAYFYFLKGTEYAISDWRMLWLICKRALFSFGAPWNLAAIGNPTSLFYTGLFGAPSDDSISRATQIRTLCKFTALFENNIKMSKIMGIYTRTLYCSGFIIGMTYGVIVRDGPSLYPGKYKTFDLVYTIGKMIFDGVQLSILTAFGHMFLKNVLTSLYMCIAECPYRLYEMFPEDYQQIQSGIDQSLKFNRPLRTQP